MKRRIIAAWLSFVMVFSIVVILDVTTDITPIVRGTTLYVNTTGIGAYSKIQDAIDNASDGYTVFVYNGTYHENVVVNKTINLTGEARENTIIDGGGGDYVLRIDVAWVNITSFTVLNSGAEPPDVGIKLNNVHRCRIINNNVSISMSMNMYGIYLYLSSNNNITGNIVTNNWHGIQLESSSYNYITDNNVISNFKSGIHLDSSSDNNLINNNASDNEDGIYLESSSNNNTIINNDLISNDFCGINILSSSNNNLSDNNIYLNEYEGIWLRSSWNNSIINNNVSNNKGGIEQDSSWNNTYINNNCSNNKNNGIFIDSSSGNNTITHNNCSDNGGGIYVSRSWNNTIDNNTCNANNAEGIRLSFFSWGNTIENNTCNSNYWEAISLSSSSYNRIENNLCFNNEAGIILYDSSNNNIIKCFVAYNEQNGISLHSSLSNNITDCHVADNYEGVFLQDSPNNTIIGCNITNNMVGFYFTSSLFGSPPNESKNNTIANNTMAGNLKYAIFSDSASTDINAKYNYFGTTDSSQIDKLVEGKINYDNWLNYRESNITYINDTILWKNEIRTLNNGLIVNGNLTMDNVTLFFNNSIGQNFIQVNDNLTIINSTFKSNSGLYTILYLNNSLGDISESDIIGLKGLSLLRNNMNITDSSLAGGSYGIYLRKGDSNRITYSTFSENECGLWIERSNKNNISDCYLSNFYCNILLIGSLKNNLTFCNASYSRWGIYLGASNNNTLSNNNIFNNTEFGIRMYLSTNNTVMNNRISKNYNGLNLSLSFNNSIYHNNFMDNYIQAYDDTGDNSWNDSYPSGGNYWSDYTGIDEKSGPGQDKPGGDGIGDTNYTINIDTKDYYPLMNPYGNYLFLYQGWNLISVPIIQPDKDLGKVLVSIKGSYDTVWWHNKSDSSDPWKVNNTSKLPDLNDLDILDHTIGFWLHITEPGGVIFHYLGTQPTENQTIIIYPGWNMVGYPSLSNKNRTAALNNLTFGDQIDSIWTYNAKVQKWEELNEPTDYFQIGKGYWIHVKTKCTWEVPL